MKEYQEKFPELFDFLASNNNVSNDMFHELDIFEVLDSVFFGSKSLMRIRGKGSSYISSFG